MHKRTTTFIQYFFYYLYQNRPIALRQKTPYIRLGDFYEETIILHDDDNSYDRDT